ncbi:MAG TPA: hypothetical protein DDZ80_11765 [Cyanobacteria bacterium UBA8803]|nr:hypothetical protein [Cyanobacteria bacterium UBA9273]HBL59160.1 hypothetical protein [Cyanobacteria bacterium UBA8803]
MDETIRINFVSKNKWSEVLQGFPAEQINGMFEIRNSNGLVAGTICESLEGRYYINGQPDIEYASLEIAAGVLLKG